MTEADGGQDVAFEVKAIRTSNPDVFATQRITIRVLDENRPPESNGIPQQTVQEESLLEINLSEYFTDTDVPGGDLTFSLEDAAGVVQRKRQPSGNVECPVGPAHLDARREARPQDLRGDRASD